MVDIVDTIYSDVQSHPFTTPKRISLLAKDIDI